LGALDDGFSSSPLVNDKEEEDGFSSSAASPTIPAASRRRGSILITTVPSEATYVGYGVSILFLIFSAIFLADAGGGRYGVAEVSEFLAVYFIK
jgi:hypothetical protein